MSVNRSLLSWLLCLLAATVTAAGQATAEELTYNKDIRPILSENCFFCHGFDSGNRHADLRLDTSAGATDDRGGYQAILPGKPKESEVVARIFAEGDEQMPPADSAYSLTAEQKDKIRRWIQQGAAYQEHWAYTSLQRPNAPKQNNPIDAFLHQAWEDQGLAPVEPATPRQLIRRLSFDLRGLPPSYEEVERFQTDPSDAAYDQLVTKWMASIEFAEHQATRWLDLVRWADSTGMVSDEPFQSGAYRAYVIESYRDNLPFDQFTIEQLAGDLIARPTDRSLIASGYNRIVKTNCEAGVIDKEALYALKGEHVRALGTVWLGSTTGCCECHDHKYDPFTAKDYYSLASFFDDLIEVGVYTPGDRRVPLHYVHQTSSDSQRDAELSKRHQQRHARILANDRDGQTEWEAATKQKLADNSSRSEFRWIPSHPAAPRIAIGDFQLTEHEGRLARKVEAIELHRHGFAENATGFFSRSAIVASDKDAFYVDVFLDVDDSPEMLAVQVLHGDYGRLGWKPEFDETYYWGTDTSEAMSTSSDWLHPANAKRMGDLPEAGSWQRLKIPKSALISTNKYYCVGMAWIQSPGTVAWGDSGIETSTAKVAELELGETAIRKWRDKPHYRMVFQKRMTVPKEALNQLPKRRSELQIEMVREAFLEQSQPELMDELREIESELAKLRWNSRPVLVSRAATPKQTRLLSRGNFMDESGPIMKPEIPEFLGELPTNGRRANRLDLAQWLVSDENPLTARVFVNRLWHQYFGRGLSETLEDSGGQGAWPSHLDLLNWLAVEFRESGWDRNHMTKLLVSSSSYKLSSRPTEQLAEKDPSNRWHARQSRYRLSAEAIRDSALSVARILQPTTEIPWDSFYPYQPARYWDRSCKVMYGSRHLPWRTSSDNHQYQRTIYTFWKRQNIHPTLLAFDAPTRQECTARRDRTNTPGQALTLLNDPIFVESARVLAQSIAQQDGNDDEKVTAVFQGILQRKPSEEEASVMQQLLDREREHFKADPEAATSFVSIGQYPVNTKVAPDEIAAWTAVTRAMLNLHEFLTRS
ncbi:MAG: PSD1 and planctomycete cytochrome C domain-containing protein [Rubripirellula sp.]